MNIDISRIIGAVSRSLLDGERDGRPTRIIVASRTYPTDREDTWDALTNRERIPRWFLPVSGDLRVGGRFQLQGNAGGEILRCDRPEHLAVTWEFAGQTSWVDVRLAADGAKRTRLELRHEAHVPDELWDQFGPGAVGVGWDLALVGLDLHIESGAPVDPAAFQAFVVTPGGRQLVEGSSADWCRASIAAGTAPAAAEGAAARTTAFYTGAGGDEPAAAP